MGPGLFKNHSFLDMNSIFWVQTGPGGQPGVQVCSENSSFLHVDSLVWVPNGSRSPARGLGLF